MPNRRNSKLARRYRQDDCNQDSEADYYVPKTIPEAKLQAISAEYRRRQLSPSRLWRLRKDEEDSEERELDTPRSGYRPRGRGGRQQLWSNKRSDQEFKYPDPRFRKILNKSRVAGGRLDTDVLLHELVKTQDSDADSCTTTETVIRKPPQTHQDQFRSEHHKY